MKNLSLVLIALLLTAPAIADEAKADIKAPLLLASADTTTSVNLQKSESNDLGVRLDKEVSAANELLSAKISTELSAQIAKTLSNLTF